MNLILGTSVFSTFTLWRPFSFFYFILFSLRAQKAQKRKQVNKLLFPPRMFFKRILNFCSLVASCAFAWLRLCAFGAFDAFGAFGACKIFS